MPKILYVEKKFHPVSLSIIEKANEIIRAYQADGLELTLRQLYYQFVAHDYFPDDKKWTWTGSKWVKDLVNGTKNAEPNYKWLGGLINDGRLAGLIDWESIIDRTRNIQQNSHWSNASEIIDACAKQFQLNKWEGQDNYCEVWIEKDALIGVIESPCRDEDVSFFSCRGYTSQSEMWEAAQRLGRQARLGKKPIIFHLGDHDPSGVDMSRDIQDRLLLLSSNLHCRERIEVRRIALTMDQIEEYNPPPNPAKLTDSRCESYIEKYGDESWELDALEPRVLVNLVRESILSIRDEDQWDEMVDKQSKQREYIQTVADNYVEPE